MANQDFRRRNLAYRVDPLWQSFDFPVGELAERGLSHPEGCEVVFSHGDGKPRGCVSANLKRVEIDRWSRGN